MLFVTALIANWKSSRRNLLLLALTLFVIGGVMAGLYLEPTFDEIKKIGFRDEIDPVLQARAATWYATDWGVWAIGATAAVCLLLALVRPAAITKADSD